MSLYLICLLRTCNLLLNILILECLMFGGSHILFQTEPLNITQYHRKNIDSHTILQAEVFKNLNDTVIFLTKHT